MDPASTARLASRLRAVNCMHGMYSTRVQRLKYPLTGGPKGVTITIFASAHYSPAQLRLMGAFTQLFDYSLTLGAEVLAGVRCSCVDVLKGRFNGIKSILSRGTVFGLAVAEAILILRTYALSSRRRSVLIFFTTIWACGVAASIILLEFFLRSATYGPPSPGIPGCNLTGGTAVFAGIPFIIVLLNDTIIMMYTLWIGLINYRNSRNPLILTLYRDGISYYFFLCVISAVNLAILLQAPMPTAQLFNTFLRVLHSVLSTRILLHVRDIESSQSERTLTGVIPRVVLSFGGTSVEIWQQLESMGSCTFPRPQTALSICGGLCSDALR
ncbi:hypothetical protein K438DRAFT_1938848, partial [Mycena galopus ATCC 62051]